MLSHPPLMTAVGCDAWDSKSLRGMNGPAAFPQEEASVLLFVHSSTTFAPVSAPEHLCSPHSHSQGLPRAASPSHLQISFTRHPIHPWPVSRRGGQESGAHTSSSSSSFLPPLQMAFCEGLSLLFPWGRNLGC